MNRMSAELLDAEVNHAKVAVVGAANHPSYNRSRALHKPWSHTELVGDTDNDRIYRGRSHIYANRKTKRVGPDSGRVAKTEAGARRVEEKAATVN